MNAGKETPYLRLDSNDPQVLSKFLWFSGEDAGGFLLDFDSGHQHNGTSLNQIPAGLLEWSIREYAANHPRARNARPLRAFYDGLRDSIENKDMYLLRRFIVPFHIARHRGKMLGELSIRELQSTQGDWIESKYPLFSAAVHKYISIISSMVQAPTLDVGSLLSDNELAVAAEEQEIAPDAMGPNDSGTAPISPDEDITMNHSDEANVEGGSGAADIDLSDEANFMEVIAMIVDDDEGHGFLYNGQMDYIIYVLVR